MKDNIFSNFYAKVLSFFTAGKDEAEASSSTASNRLKLVLMQDRSNLDGATLQKMREQLINVISKYIEIDTEALDLNLEGDGEEIALMLNIPVVRARTPEEIDELEAKEEEEKQLAIQKAVDEALNKDKDASEEKDEENDESEDDEEAKDDEEKVEDSDKDEENKEESEEKEKEEDKEEAEAENNDSDEKDADKKAEEKSEENNK